MTQTEGWTMDGVPIAFDSSKEVRPDRRFVRSGVKCLVHGQWEALAWDGSRLAPACCLTLGRGDAP